MLKDMLQQEIYMEQIARRNFTKFFEQGYATAGHNGPHGHTDTPVRNTAHYLVIYSYLYKKYKEPQFLEICDKFVRFLTAMQAKTESGAIQCMTSDLFDHMNGLIGQAWVIEALIYYYEVTGSSTALNLAKKIYDVPKYNKIKHLWERVELDGTNIGIDPTSNHQVWFAACSYKLADYCQSIEIDDTIRDFLTFGQSIILNTHTDGLLKHSVNINDPIIKAKNRKRFVKKLLFPLRPFFPRKLNLKYMEYGYHIFDLYGYAILHAKYSDLPLYRSKELESAIRYAQDLDKLNVLNNSSDIRKTNVYFYKYNSPAFEWPFIASEFGFYNEEKVEQLYNNQVRLNYDKDTGDFSSNNPDIETWNARTYEIIRYIDSLK